jgi:hypothetical protein
MVHITTFRTRATAPALHGSEKAKITFLGGSPAKYAVIGEMKLLIYTDTLAPELLFNNSSNI